MVLGGGLGVLVLGDLGEDLEGRETVEGGQTWVGGLTNESSSTDLLRSLILLQRSSRQFRGMGTFT